MNYARCHNLDHNGDGARGVRCGTNSTRSGEREGDTSTNNVLLRKVLNVIQHPQTKEPELMSVKARQKRAHQ